MIKEFYNTRAIREVMYEPKQTICTEYLIANMPFCLHASNNKNIFLNFS